MCKLSQLEGIGVKFIALLHEAGIEDQDQLLEACSQPNERQQLAKATGINSKLILKWTQQADLSRINGIGEEYAELLIHCGVGSVQQLSLCNPEKLMALMQEYNEQTKLVRALPGKTSIEDWIEQAKTIPVKLEP
ncbi:DUF4332 domain-containing protein [Legionella impletisoli]|uniref:Ferredoxin n=1 Tax=Legionella impletisoli TaxID=343510 RepID=A0A917NAS2_9GAMM|nr:DUF4332 domain-containing protein [Legionella impletisoli]GGI83928.1 ferredoxin [Legionella impletisoli]